ncbi:Negative regulator of systemic acquired resistance SNI1 [Vitis vinifera]|uniref:Negative regulator of systemic acquired resistance SNI1 n=1 Tax=Vitis vinifera TaxID=29760 RepID=A0A438IGD5_VITVI|nr:Negative regulator of systemic acquired resistance SNI1 [Vitis vinifera]
MESSSRSRSHAGSIEENTMAIIDAAGAKDTQDTNDDRMAFLEAVRASSIVPETGTAPTNKMFEAIFQILKVGKSLELIMASYQLLNELDKCFPRAYLSNVDKSNSSCTALLEPVVVKEAWSPFSLGSDATCGERQTANKNSGGPLDSSGFHLLIQNIVKVTDEMNSQALNIKLELRSEIQDNQLDRVEQLKWEYWLQASDAVSLGNMFLFQYLVNVLEGDFLPRNSMYKAIHCCISETMNWTLLRESLINMLLGSRKISYKGFIKDCLSLISRLCHVYAGFSHDPSCEENSAGKQHEKCDTAVAIAFLEVKNCTCISVQKLLVLVRFIMELDMSKKKADMQGHTTRADGVRTPLVEIIIDELTYNEDILSPFLQVFNEPKWKLEIALQYFWKYISKPSVRTRRSNGPTEDATFGGLLKYFSNNTNTKNVIRKIGTEVAQLLLAHAFQACGDFAIRKRSSIYSGNHPLNKMSSETVTSSVH